MRGRWAARAAGVWAAAVTPLWLRDDRWRRLLDEPPAGPGAPRPDALLAGRYARRAVELLSRVPRGPWRSTCLYRSVAECLVLRRYGLGARLRIGVGRESEGDAGIMAHAWVLRPGESDGAADPRASSLRVLDSLP